MIGRGRIGSARSAIAGFVAGLAVELIDLEFYLTLSPICRGRSYSLTPFLFPRRLSRALCRPSISLAPCGLRVLS